MKSGRYIIIRKWWIQDWAHTNAGVGGPAPTSPATVTGICVSVPVFSGTPCAAVRPRTPIGQSFLGGGTGPAGTETELDVCVGAALQELDAAGSQPETGCGLPLTAPPLGTQICSSASFAPYSLGGLGSSRSPLQRPIPEGTGQEAPWTQTPAFSSLGPGQSHPSHLGGRKLLLGPAGGIHAT